MQILWCQFKEVEVILQKIGLLDSKKTIAEKLSTGTKATDVACPEL